MLKVMAVDDEVIFREYLVKVIDWETHGFSICSEAKNGFEALELAERENPDVVLVDICMPLMDGLDFTEKLKERFPKTSVVLITGHSEFEYARKAVRLGVEDYILKPFKKEELLDILIKIKYKIQKEREEINLKKGSFTVPENVGRRKITRSSRLVEKVKEYINNHYGRCELSVEEIAASMYINSSYLRRIFKKECGIPVSDYITGIRIQKAKELLGYGNIKLSEISKSVGYSDAGYFSKCFKRYTGMSPSDYENIRN